MIDGATSNLWLIDVSDGAMHRVTDVADRPVLITRRLSWSRDSRSIYAAAAEIDADVVLLKNLLPQEPADRHLAAADSNPSVMKVREYVKTHLSCEAVVISAQIESDLVDLEPRRGAGAYAGLNVSFVPTYGRMILSGIVRIASLMNTSPLQCIGTT